ncbi:MAG: choice-of-anchor tandem repeat NxxGxxAF-containing protein [Planctomycetota bacterium]
MVRSGDPAPGFFQVPTLDPVFLAEFREIALSDAGDVALLSGFVDPLAPVPPSAAPLGVFRFGARGSRERIVTEDRLVPTSLGAGSGAVVSILDWSIPLQLAASGDLVVTAGILDPMFIPPPVPGNDALIFDAEPDGALSTITSTLEPIGGDAAVQFVEPRFLDTNDAGDLAMNAVLLVDPMDGSEPAFESGVVARRAGGPLRVVARPGTPIGGRAFPLEFERTGAGDAPALVNGIGDLLFSAVLASDGLPSGSARALILAPADESEARALILPGDPAPELPGVEFAGVGTLAVSDSGVFAVVTPVEGPGFGLQSEALYRGTPGSLELVARSGSPTPGLPAGESVQRFRTPTINAAGEVAFVAEFGEAIDSRNDRVVYSDGGGAGLRPLATEGAQATGFAPGVRHDALLFATIDNEGRSAFVSTVASDDRALRGLSLFATDPGGEPFRVAWPGQVIDVAAEGETPRPKTVAGVDLSTLTFGGLDPIELNGSGELAFVAEFTDGSEAVIVATLPASCGTADLASPLGAVSYTDVAMFVELFTAEDARAAAFAEPMDVVNSADIDAFVAAFFAGCAAN